MLLLRVPTTVGMIPCTAKPQRPLSVRRPEDLDQPESLQPKFATRRRSPSPFLVKDQAYATFKWEGGNSKPRQISALDPRSDLVTIDVSENLTAGVESSGQVVLWEEAGPKHLPGLSGMSIVNVAVGKNFICLLTDRGILLTKGKGRSGCLGHGDTRDVSTPKIVEALLGDDIVEVCAGDKHVAVVTSDGEVFTWGDGEYGCLGLGSGRGVCPTPEVVELDEDVDKVFCGSYGTALLAPDGRYGPI